MAFIREGVKLWRCEGEPVRIVLSRNVVSRTAGEGRADRGWLDAENVIARNIFLSLIHKSVAIYQIRD